MYNIPRVHDFHCVDFLFQAAREYEDAGEQDVGLSHKRHTGTERPEADERGGRRSG